MLSASENALLKEYGKDHTQIREAMNGMLTVNFKYSISGSHWLQFTNDVVRAFDHPVFSGLRRVNQPSQVVCLLRNLRAVHNHSPPVCYCPLV